MEKYEGMSFDEAMKLFEEKISLLEKDEDGQDVEKIYQEAVELRDYCAKLLSDEREEIKRIAKENNIPLSKIGLEENEDEDDDDEDEDEEEDNNDNNE